MTQVERSYALVDANGALPRKLHGRAFYESIGSPKIILAPMVDRSEFAWRLLTRSYLDRDSSKPFLAYSPMLHARLFTEAQRFRDAHFQPTRTIPSSGSSVIDIPWLDGNPVLDRPLFVQFCANKPDELLEAARYVEPFCDAIDLNLGCPQGIAKAGHYGAFLQEDWDAIYKLINKLHQHLSIPVTAKMRILDSKEKTLDYAKMILSAGASIIAVHGRRREQKSHNTGVADWSFIRYLRENLPQDTVIFANGNILNGNDIQRCLDSTGADGIMSAEGNLSDPTIFAIPPSPDPENREYWRDQHGLGGYRIDGVFRRYMDIIHKHVLDESLPMRPPLYLPTDPTTSPARGPGVNGDGDEPPRKKPKLVKGSPASSPNLKPMQGHLFQILRPMISSHTHIRDALAKCGVGDIASFERVLSMVEDAVEAGLQEHAENLAKDRAQPRTSGTELSDLSTGASSQSSSVLAKYKRSWWICQPHLRPLPEEAFKTGAMTLSKKEKAKVEETKREAFDDAVARVDHQDDRIDCSMADTNSELPREALVCG